MFGSILLQAFLPEILQIVSIILTGLLSWLAVVLKRKFKIEIEVREREALHSALLTGIRAALQNGLKGSAAVDAALDYAKLSVPGTMKKLKPGETVLRELAISKLSTVLEKL